MKAFVLAGLYDEEGWLSVAKYERGKLSQALGDRDMLRRSGEALNYIVVPAESWELYVTIRKVVDAL